MWPGVTVIGCGAGPQAGVPEAVEAGNLSGFGLGVQSAGQG